MRMTFDPGVPLLEHVATELPRLRKSEQAVAHLVTENPEMVVNSTMAMVAEAAGVSEPTVMRFCTSLGFEGFQQFKVALAQSVALGLPATVSAIGPDEPVGLVASKMFDHTITSLDRARRYINAERLESAVNAILAAPSMLLSGLGASGLIASDAEQKAVLFGIPVSFPPDPHQQFMAVAMAPEGSVLLAISNTGRTNSILDIVRRGKQSGMFVIAITGDDENPLAASADSAIVVKTFEDTDMVTPTVSRIAGLVVIDVLATAVSLRRGSAHAKRLSTMKNDLATFRGTKRS
jgi:RpiR family transcriptional regulator, carbohydrate utilization regulator